MFFLEQKGEVIRNPCHKSYILKDLLILMNALKNCTNLLDLRLSSLKQKLHFNVG